MNRKVIWVIGLVVVAAAVFGVWRWRGRDRGEPATSTVVQPAATGSAAPVAVAVAAPGRISVRVTDAKGPLAGALVRLAPDDGEVVTLRTGADGLARSDALAPGDWEISASAADHEPAALPAYELKPGETATLEVVLAAGGRRLTGVVTDVNGGPIAGARIDAARLQMARPDRAIATTLTGADGTYALTVAEGHLLVAARSADYAAQSRYVEVGASGATADFALVPGGVIEGVVLDGKTRQPVAHAVIDARRERSGAMLLAESGGHHVVAGADGKFRIAGLRPGVFELRAAADARRTRTQTIVGLGVAEQVSDVELLVGAGPVIRGKVVDEADAVVADATVRAAMRGEEAEVTSDAKGAFAIEGLPPGSYHVSARSDAHVSALWTPVELADRDVGDVVVRVKRGAKLRGHVEPRQVAEVRLEAESRPLRGMMNVLAPRTTKADGEFEISPVELGQVELSARCPSGDQGTLQVAVVDGMPEVVLKVAPGASIAGRVTDGDSKPVAGASVMAAAIGGSETTIVVNGVVTSGAQAITSSDGAYEVRGLRPGAYRLRVLDRGKPMRMRAKSPQVTIAGVERKTGVDLSVDRPNGVIKGVVSSADGTPLADAWVSVHQDLGALVRGMADDGDEERPSPGRSVGRMLRIESTDDGGGGGAGGETPPALTDAQGRFEIRGLAHGEYEVVAEAQAGKLRARTAGVSPDATVNLRMVGLTSLSGTVRGAKGPAAQFTLELEGPTRAQRTFTDGTFELGRVDPGTYTLRVSSSDGNAKQQLEVIAGKAATVDIVLVANAIVVGTVVDANGKPLEGLPVVVVPDKGGPLSVTIDGPPPTTGPDGRFRIEHEAGPSAVLVMTPPRPTSKRGLTLEAGKTLDVGAIRVEPGASAPP